MSHVVKPEALMRYLDGELEPEERARIGEHLRTCTECARDIAVFSTLKGDLESVSFRDEPGRSPVWDRVNRHITRPVGWLLFVVGVVVYAVYAAYTFITTPGWPWEKLTTAAIVIGLALLLASVIWDRYREWRTDPYREIKR